MPGAHQNHNVALPSTYSTLPPETSTKDSITEETPTTLSAHVDSLLNSAVTILSFLYNTHNSLSETSTMAKDLGSILWKYLIILWWHMCFLSAGRWDNEAWTRDLGTRLTYLSISYHLPFPSEMVLPSCPASFLCLYPVVTTTFCCPHLSVGTWAQVGREPG